MKKSRNCRRRTAKLTTKNIIEYQYFINIGRSMNARNVELRFQRDNKVVASADFIEDAPHKQTIIRWYDHRYYALPYGAKEVKPYSMTLAKWKSMNNG